MQWSKYLYCYNRIELWLRSSSRQFRSVSAAVEYAENFHGGALVQGHRWPFVFGVRCLWRHNLTSFTCFQTNVLAKFVDIICTFFYIHTPYFMCHCTEYEYKLWALQVRLSDKNNINATTQQFITAKISGCALTQGSETHSSLRQSNLQLQIIYLSCAKVSSNTSSWALKVCGWTGWRTRWFARSNFTKLHKNWECAKCTQENVCFLWCIEVHRSVPRGGRSFS